jgi:diguanylate cyclase (GGDEF)-like protein/PAS domain S-box-containing protein
MNWDISIYSVPLWIASLVSIFLAAYSWRFRNFIGVKQFTFLMLAVAVWCLGYGFEIAAPGMANKIFWAKVQYFGIVSVPIFWLLYTIHFTGTSYLLSRRVRLLLPVISVITLLLALTNEWHGLIWKEIQIHSGPFHDLSIRYGLWFWVNIVYSYLLILIGTVLLVRFFIYSQGLFRRQSSTLLVAALFPWLGNALYLFGLNPVPDLDLTPFAFATSGIIIAWGVLQLRFLGIAPLARYAVVESMSDAVFVVDTWGRIIDINPAALVLLQATADFIGMPAELVFRKRLDLYHRFKDSREVFEVIRVSDAGMEKYFEVRISPLRDARGNYTGRLIVLHDVTELEEARLFLQEAQQELEQRVKDRTNDLETANQMLQAEVSVRRAAEEALLYQTLHDLLTGLPNRRMFLERLEYAFERSHRHLGVGFAVLFLDLDQFKEVNDNLGHVLGDQFLIAIAHRLRQSLRTVDTLARFGGDEFAVLVDEIQDAHDPLLVAERILKELAEPILLEGNAVVSSASIGIALAGTHYRHPEEILRDADAAMYQAKAEGRGRYKVFQKDAERGRHGDAVTGRIT